MWNLLKCLIQTIFSIVLWEKSASHFFVGITIINKHGQFIHTLMGTDVNQTCLSVNGGSLEISPTAVLIFVNGFQKQFQ